MLEMVERGVTKVTLHHPSLSSFYYFFYLLLRGLKKYEVVDHRQILNLVIKTDTFWYFE